jgi:hypothetical protein
MTGAVGAVVIGVEPEPDPHPGSIHSIGKAALDKANRRIRVERDMQAGL